MDMQTTTTQIMDKHYNPLIGTSAEETAINCEKVLGLLSNRVLFSNISATDDFEKEAMWLIMKMVREALKCSSNPQ